jgi:hypothetical protein
MKIIFLFDQMDPEGKIVTTDINPYVITPDKLQLKVIGPGQTGLGVTLEKADDKGEKVQTFYSIITFPVNLLPAGTLQDEINNLKQLLGQKLAQQITETQTAAVVPVETPAPTPSAEQAVSAPAGANGVAKATAKKAKKSSK